MDRRRPAAFLINAHAPADRFRFSLAHELGHVILHREPGVTATQERQADEFASEFLLPADTIRTELKQGRLTLPRLLELKHRWGVSMAALLRRASTLGVVSDWQYRNLMVELSAVGYRKQEPSDLVPEPRGSCAELSPNCTTVKGTTSTSWPPSSDCCPTNLPTCTCLTSTSPTLLLPR